LTLRSPQRRGERVAPPASGDKWELRFGTGDAADGWEKLSASAPGPLNACWEQLRVDPRRTSTRQHRLRDDLASRVIGGKTLEQWQYEVTGAGRVWYCPDDLAHTVWVVLAEPGHPSRTG
jgi:hypothetical protein